MMEAAEGNVTSRGGARKPADGESLPKRPRPFLPSVGLALALAWVYAPFLSGESFYIAFHLAFACTLLVCCICYHHAGTKKGPAMPGAVPFASSMFMLCAPAAVLDPSGALSAEVHQTLGVLSGCGSALLFCQWFCAFCLLPIRDAVNDTLFAFIGSAAIRLCLVPLVTLWMPAVVAMLTIMPFASQTMLRRVLAQVEGDMRGGLRPSETTAEAPEHAGDGAYRKRPVTSGGAPSGRARTFELVTSVLEIVAFGLIFGILRNGISEWSLTTHSMIMGHMLRILVPLLLYLWLLAREGDAHSDDAFRAVLVLTATALLGVIFFGGMGKETISAIVLVARSFVTILVYARLFEMAHRTGFHPCVIYGAGRGAYEFSLVAGLMLYERLTQSDMLTQMPFNFVYFAVSLVVVLLLDDFARTMTLPFMRRTLEAPRTLDELCAQASRKYALTEREAQVMRLICLGRSKRYIAEELCLSEDTVRYHTKQFYRKLDVHSRQELLSRIGVE